MSDSPLEMHGRAARRRLAGRGRGPRPAARAARRSDFDVAISSDAGRAAGALARAGHAHRFKLSEGFGAWRVVARDRRWQVDLLPLAGRTIEADLAQRDLTINAIAEPLSGGGEFVDPFGGLADLARRGGCGWWRRRRSSAIRCGRCGSRGWRASSSFAIEPETARAGPAQRSRAARRGSERIFAELKRIVTRRPRARRARR